MIFSFRTLFGIFSNGELRAISLLKRKHLTYKGGKYALLDSVTAVAVDCHSQLIFAIRTGDSSSLDLVTLDYDGNVLNTLYKVSTDRNFTGLDVFNNTAIWTSFYLSEKIRVYEVYMCKMSTTCKSENKTLVYSTSDDVSTNKCLKSLIVILKYVF